MTLFRFRIWNGQDGRFRILTYYKTDLVSKRIRPCSSRFALI
jgi:hypothetical protein